MKRNNKIDNWAVERARSDIRAIIRYETYENYRLNNDELSAYSLLCVASQACGNKIDKLIIEFMVHASAKASCCEKALFAVVLYLEAQYLSTVQMALKS